MLINMWFRPQRACWAAMAASLVASLGPSPAKAFSPGPLAGINCNSLTAPIPCTTAGFFGANGANQYVENHQLITRDGLAQVAYIPPAGLGYAQTAISFSPASVLNIADNNAQVDLNQDDHVLHFDNELLNQSASRVIQGRHSLIEQLLFSGAAADTQAGLGRYLHTLQDFFAHSTWAKEHPLSTAVLPQFVVGEAVLSNPPKNQAFCDPVYHTDIIFPGLTSGYAGNPLQAAIAESAKCAHGFLGNGIHNDWAGRAHYTDARAWAVYATAAYVNAIIHASVDPDAVCQMMTNSNCPKIAQTITSLTSNLSSVSVPGGAVILTASVAANGTVAAGVPPPGGTMTFQDQTGAVLCNVIPVASGVATCAASISVAPDVINAIYSGDGNYASSTGTITIQASPGTVKSVSFSFSSTVAGDTANATGQFSINCVTKVATDFSFEMDIVSNGLTGTFKLAFTNRTIDYDCGTNVLNLEIGPPQVAGTANFVPLTFEVLEQSGTEMGYVIENPPGSGVDYQGIVTVQ